MTLGQAPRFNSTAGQDRSFIRIGWLHLASALDPHGHVTIKRQRQGNVVSEADNGMHACAHLTRRLRGKRLREVSRQECSEQSGDHHPELTLVHRAVGDQARTHTHTLLDHACQTVIIAVEPRANQLIKRTLLQFVASATLATFGLCDLMDREGVT